MQDADLMKKQIELEQLFSKNQLTPRIKAEFTGCKEIDFSAFFQQAGIPLDFGFAFLVQMALHKRASLPTMVGVLRSHCETAQQVADLILKLVELEVANWDPVTERLIVIITIGDDVQAELDRFQFPLPMVVEPREVKTNRDTGYVLNRGSIILKKNHHSGDVCLDHINRQNRIKLTIDRDTATMVKNTWRNLDKPKEGESREDFEKRVRAFEKYDRTCKDVHDKLAEAGDHFYLTHKYDKRGRIYCQGYHVSYMGAPWNKAVIQLADKEIVEL